MLHARKRYERFLNFEHRLALQILAPVWEISRSVPVYFRMIPNSRSKNNRIILVVSDWYKLFEIVRDVTSKEPQDPICEFQNTPIHWEPVNTKFEFQSVLSSFIALNFKTSQPKKQANPSNSESLVVRGFDNYPRRDYGIAGVQFVHFSIWFR